MYKFSKRSKRNLEQCHPDLQLLFNEVIKRVDCSVICGYRSKEDQNKAFYEGKSMVLYPNSKHNQKPSLAVDVVPYPLPDWEDELQFMEFVTIVKEVAEELNIDIICGADFTSILDYPHVELRRSK